MSKISVCMIFPCSRFHQKNLSGSSHDLKTVVQKDSRLWTWQSWGNEGSKDHKLYFQESLHHCLNNPDSLQMWWKKTVPVQVLLSDDPPFIKGFYMGFPSGSAVWTAWYAPVQRTWGHLWIWLYLEAETPAAGGGSRAKRRKHVRCVTLPLTAQSRLSNFIHCDLFWGVWEIEKKSILVQLRAFGF